MKLKELGEIVTGNTPSKKVEDYYESNDISFFKPGDLDENYILDLEKSEEYISEKARGKARIIPKESILVTCIGTIGKVGILLKEASCNQQINAIIPNEKVLPKYLAYLIFSKQKYIQKKANAPVVPIINKSDFSEIDVKICDLDSQRLIVQKLDLVKNIIDIKKKQITELENLIKSQFVEMFGKVKSKDKIKNVCNYLSRGKSPNYVESSEIEVINQACIYWNEFRMENTKFQDSSKVAKSAEKILRKRDVLITSTGTGTLGRCNVFEGVENKYLADGHVTILRLNEGILNPIFFKYYFMQDTIQKKLYSDCVNGSTNQIELAKDNFLEFDVTLPDIDSQNKFEQFTSHINKLEFELKKSLEEMQNLFDSLMAEYFE